jgi:hypothetical protein
VIMGDTNFHIKKAERNEQFFQSNNLRTSTFDEWGVVVLFYSAVHYVDAVLARETRLPPNQQHPPEHWDRNTGVAQSLTLGHIFNDYMRLYDRSLDARYKLISFKAGVLNDLQTTCFEPVKNCVRTFLRLPESEGKEQSKSANS